MVRARKDTKFPETCGTSTQKVTRYYHRAAARLPTPWRADFPLSPIVITLVAAPVITHIGSHIVLTEALRGNNRFFSYVKENAV